MGERVNGRAKYSDKKLAEDYDRAYTLLMILASHKPAIINILAALILIDWPQYICIYVCMYLLGLVINEGGYPIVCV